MEISRNFKGKNPGRFTYGGYGIHKKIIQDGVDTSYNNGYRIYNYLGIAYYNGNRLIRLLYYLPMERMGKEKESGTLLEVGAKYLPVKEIKGEFYVKVSDFTRCMDGMRIEQEADRKHIEELEEENKTLKDNVEFLHSCLDDRDKSIAIMQEENKKLKKYYDRDKEELMESCYSLAKENEKLKSDLSECECSFGYENDEVGFWKLEYKRLKKWIKDHCKGYGNLFPEDEMKRQWKKADKKRK